MGIRELKEEAHRQFVQGKFAQCAQTYLQLLKLEPKDPNLRVRHAEACRRSGDRQQAIASYQAAAALLLELGCETRARAALKAALELAPKDPRLLAELTRLSQPAPPTMLEDERLYTGMHAAVAAVSASTVPLRRPLPSAPAIPPVVLPQPRPMASQRPGPVVPSSAPVPATPSRAEVRRLSANALAFRLSPASQWVLIRSHTPIEVQRVKTLDPREG